MHSQCCFVAGVGKIFVLFVDIEGAAKARNAVNGRTFNGNVVEAMYYPEELLLQKVCGCAYSLVGPK